jgi:FlaA1/EpsC-like NDP-sugar epimerase
LAGIYAGFIGASFYAAYEVRFEFFVPPEQQVERVRLLPWVIALKLGTLVLFRQFGTLMTYFSLPDLNRLVGAMALASGVLFLPRALGWREFGAPRGVLLVDFMLAFGVLCGGRLAARLYRERLSGAGRAPGRALQRIAIIGAGDVGARLANEFLSHPARGFQPVMLLDDDQTKHGKHVHGVAVAGRPELLAEQRVAEELDKVVIAMPSAPARRIREVLAAAATHGLKVEIVPSLEELAAGRVKTSRVRPVEVQDLLGRSAVEIDTAGIRRALAGKVVLVTGAGGSIGSELGRQIAALNPERLLLVDQSEAALFLIEQELNEQGFGGTITPLVADVLDRPRMEAIFRRYGPQVVFHAAAHKHVFLMERQPAEAIRNNAFGSRQLAEIAAAHGVEAFTLISTDKAINPTNVMGATKRLAELLVMDVAREGGREESRGEMGEGLRGKGDEPKSEGGIALGASSAGTSATSHRSAPRFSAVRFGNVLGSSGSVIPIFKRQIDQGGPVTVTHPDVTRYFMTIPEAVGLVLQSFVLGQGGEIFVLDMGQPVKIVDLARQMIELSGYRVGEDIEIVFSGLKPGEKLFEELQHHTEEYAPTAHPRIMRFKAKAALDVSGLLALESRLHAMEPNQLKSALKQLVPEYSPHLD